MVNSVNYQVGDLVQHYQFGVGTVIGFSKFEDGRDVVQVNFERVGKKKLVIEYARLEKISVEYLESKKADLSNWPASTFFYDAGDKVHDIGRHWIPFFEDKAELVNNIPVYYKNGVMGSGFGEFYQSPMTPPTNWREGFQHNSPNHDSGISMVIESKPEGGNLINFFPFYAHGSQLTLKLNRVDVWRSGIEAQITASWGDAIVHFFDTRYICNRAWYLAGRDYEFILTGIAYVARPSALGEVTFKIPQGVLEQVEKLMVEEDVDKQDLTDEVSFGEAAMFLPLENGDIDDFQFHARIKQIKPFSDLVGRSGWEVVATVMRDIGQGIDDADLKIAITERAWMGKQPPQVGEYIEGRLWLQGYLWNVPNKAAF
jgi:hypothetical protein